MPEEIDSSDLKTTDIIAQAKDEFQSKFDQIIAAVSPVVTPDAVSKPESEVVESSPPPKVKPKDRDLEEKLREDKELHDFVQRQIQSTKDRTTAELNKLHKQSKQLESLQEVNQAFLLDWQNLDTDAKMAWLENQPEYVSTVSEKLQETSKAIVADLMDLLGADPDGVTSEMLSPENRDKLATYLLSSKIFTSEREKIKSDAYELGKAAATSDARAGERRPSTGSSMPSSRPQTMAEAKVALLDGLLKLGL